MGGGTRKKRNRRGWKGSWDSRGFLGIRLSGYRWVGGGGRRGRGGWGGGHGILEGSWGLGCQGEEGDRRRRRAGKKKKSNNPTLQDRE